MSISAAPPPLSNKASLLQVQAQEGESVGGEGKQEHTTRVSSTPCLILFVTAKFDGVSIAFC